MLRLPTAFPLVHHHRITHPRHTLNSSQHLRPLAQPLNPRSVFCSSSRHRLTPHQPLRCARRAAHAYAGSFLHGVVGACGGEHEREVVATCQDVFVGDVGVSAAVEELLGAGWAGSD